MESGIESGSPEKHHPVGAAQPMCDDSDETLEEYRTQLLFPLLASVSMKMSTEIDAFALAKQIDQHASNLFKQLDDEQAQDIMERAFAPRVRNPSAYITRAAKTKLRDEALRTWPSGGDDSEWWGKTDEEK